MATVALPLTSETSSARPSIDDVSTPNAIARTCTETDPPWPTTDSSGLAGKHHYADPRTNLEIPEGCISHYEIIRKIGQGGMGSVFRARDRRLDRLVALKILHHGGQSPSRLLAEARATARVTHENIVVIYDTGMHEGRPYMVLEHLYGQTLRRTLNEAKSGAGRELSRGVSLDIVISVVRALSAAHKGRIVHSDLKPENIMLLKSGQVKVLDFGIARRIGAENRDKPVGTFAYMSPEQWLGRDVDQRSDIWAVGILLFELLSGAHPLAPLSTRDLSMIAELDLPMPSLRDECPELGELSDIVARCLAKRKEQRFASADELLVALESWRTR